MNGDDCTNYPGRITRSMRLRMLKETQIDKNVEDSDDDEQTKDSGRCQTSRNQELTEKVCILEMEKQNRFGSGPLNSDEAKGTQATSEDPKPKPKETNFSQAQIWRLLDYDRQFRNINATGDLITMSEDTFSWKGATGEDRKYALPTLTMNISKELVSTPCFNPDKFVDRLYHKYAPELCGIDWKNLFLGGGLGGTIIHHDAVSQICDDNWTYHRRGDHPATRNDYGKPDVDLFIYGLNEDEANAKVKQITNHLISEGNKNFLSSESRVTVRRSQYVFTLEFYNKFMDSCVRKYQIIFRLYHTQSEILHGFDLGSSEVGFDGSAVRVTSLGKFALEYGCNILDPSRRSNSYERRGYKYLRRGYDIVMPYFSTGAQSLLRSPLLTLDLPYFSADLIPSLSGLTENRLVAKHMYVKTNQNNLSIYEDNDPFDKDSIFYRNLHCLLSEKLQQLIYVKDILLMTDKPEELTTDKVLTFPKDELEDRIKTFYEDSVPSLIWNGTRYDTSAVQKYLVTKTSYEIAMGLFKKSTDAEKMKYIQEMSKESAECILDGLKRRFNNQSGPQWVKDNPGAQFAPIESTAVDYYGKYMVKK